MFYSTNQPQLGLVLLRCLNMVVTHRVSLLSLAIAVLALVSTMGMPSAHATHPVPSKTRADYTSTPSLTPSIVASPSPMTTRASATAAPTPSPVPPPPPPPPQPGVNCAVQKCIALTFDDGPGAYTAQVQAMLDAHGAKATFFVLGNSVAAHPDTVKNLAADGMAIAMHTCNHPQLTALSPQGQQQEVACSAASLRAVGIEPTLLRPPYGSHNTTTDALGYPIILWNVDSEDWKNRNAQVTTQRVLAGAHPGAIVLMHDIQTATVQALPGILASLQAQGYAFATIAELIPSAHPGGVYTHQV